MKIELDLYDWLEMVDRCGMLRCCPKCGEDDIKFAIHSKHNAGCEISVRCNDCKHSEQGDNPDAERLVRTWHKTL